jgi:hypothetical protein
MLRRRRRRVRKVSANAHGLIGGPLDGGRHRDLFARHARLGAWASERWGCQNTWRQETERPAPRPLEECLADGWLLTATDALPYRGTGSHPTARTRRISGRPAGRGMPRSLGRCLSRPDSGTRQAHSAPRNPSPAGHLDAAALARCGGRNGRFPKCRARYRAKCRRGAWHMCRLRPRQVPPRVPNIIPKCRAKCPSAG